MEILNIKDRPSCIPTVAGWIYAEFIENLRGGITLDAITAALQHRRQNSIPLTYLGLVDGMCIGAVSLVGNDLQERQDLTPWLASLYIQAGHRGHGYAHLLIEKVIAVSAGLGFRTLYLRTETAGAYYARRGWTKIYATTDEFGLFTEVFALELSA